VRITGTGQPVSRAPRAAGLRFAQVGRNSPEAPSKNGSQLPQAHPGQARPLLAVEAARQHSGPASSTALTRSRQEPAGARGPPAPGRISSQRTTSRALAGKQEHPKRA